MKTKIFTLILTLTSLQALQAQTFDLVWSDEFDGPDIDMNNWTHEIGGHGWGNSEWQYYTDRPDNSYIQDGLLVIKAQEENFGGKNYTSARMISRGKEFWQYGKVEARLKVPTGQGLWPAFWMMGENIGEVGWPACGEIDIMEFIGGAGREHEAYGTAHWEQNGHASYGGVYRLSSGTFPDDFHIFSIIWSPTSIEWYIDGKRYHVIDIRGAGLSEFHQDFFILLNVAVGGNWPGYPDATTTFPQTMEVDYVRVYQYSGISPVVRMIEPASGTIHAPGEPITLQAEASFRPGIERVEFYQDQVKIGETSLRPFEMTWRNVQPGCYSIRAKAIGANGVTGRSSAIQIQVSDECVQAPYAGAPAKVPGTIEAEDYDLGGPGVGYYDSDAENSGGVYRVNEEVDIARNTDDDGHHIGWLNNNEWLNYKVQVYETASYNFEIRTAGPSSGTFHIELDDTDVTGSIQVPVTGGWDQWTTTSVTGVRLEEGIHTLKIHIESPGYNIDNIRIYKPYTGSRIDLLGPDGGEALRAGSIEEIYWYSLGIETVDIELSVDGGSTWTEIVNNASSQFDAFRWQVPETYSDNCLIRVKDHAFNQVSDVSSQAFTITYPLDIDSESVGIRNISLNQNFPNPFNPSTTISYSLPERGSVNIAIYDVNGRLVKTLRDGPQESGSHQIVWDGTTENGLALNTGIYLCKLNAAEFSETIKMVYLK